MTGLIIVTILSSGIAGVLIGFVVMTVKQRNVFMAVSVVQVDVLMAKVRQWCREAEDTRL